MIFQPGEILCHYSDAIMRAMASQITGVSIVCSNLCSGAGQRKHQSSASLAFVRGIHRWPVKWPVTQKMFPFEDVIMHIFFSLQPLPAVHSVKHQVLQLQFSRLSRVGVIASPSSVLVTEFCVRKGITWHPMFHEHVQKFIWRSIKL